MAIRLVPRMTRTVTVLLLFAILVGVGNIEAFKSPLLGALPDALSHGSCAMGFGTNFARPHIALRPRRTTQHERECRHTLMRGTTTMSSYRESYPDFDFDFESGGEIHMESVLAPDPVFGLLTPESKDRCGRRIWRPSRLGVHAVAPGAFALC